MLKDTTQKNRMATYFRAVYFLKASKSHTVAYIFSVFFTVILRILYGISCKEGSIDGMEATLSTEATMDNGSPCLHWTCFKAIILSPSVKGTASCEGNKVFLKLLRSIIMTTLGAFCPSSQFLTIILYSWP